MNAIQKHMITGIVCLFMLMFIFWSIGFWCNALLGTKFDLKSCWDGFQTLSGAGVMAAIKYIIDSLVNSSKDNFPYEKK